MLAKNLIFTLLVPGTVGVYLPWLIANRAGHTWPRPMELTFLGALLPLFTAGALYGWCLWNFAAVGRGTPAPTDPPRRLVLTGPYRLLRNPMYLSALLAIGGWSLFFGSWEVAGYGAILGVCVHLFVVLVEEPALRQRFGEDYKGYCRVTNRWLPRGPARSLIQL